MALRLTTDHLRPADRLEYWRSTVTTVLAQSDISHIDRQPLTCEIVVRRAGDLVLLNSRSSPFRSNRVERHIRSDDRDALMVGILRSGQAFVEQDGRRLRRTPGSLMFADMARPYAASNAVDHEAFGFSIPRESVERQFGSSKRFTLLPIEPALGSEAIIAFLIALYDGIDAMAAERAAEMAALGQELVLNALARRLALEPALPQSSALMMHRAQAYIASNLADPALSPATVAAALGISLRHLQTMFRRLDTSPAEWIWSARLARARNHLGAPAFAYRSIGDIAFGCGFLDQAHFSRRFKSVYGLSPRDWRRAMAMDASGVV